LLAARKRQAINVAYASEVRDGSTHCVPRFTVVRELDGRERHVLAEEGRDVVESPRDSDGFWRELERPARERARLPELQYL
jgi:hypothetical protein